MLLSITCSKTPPIKAVLVMMLRAKDTFQIGNDFFTPVWNLWLFAKLGMALSEVACSIGAKSPTTATSALKSVLSIAVN